MQQVAALYTTDITFFLKYLHQKKHIFHIFQLKKSCMKTVNPSIKSSSELDSYQTILVLIVNIFSCERVYIFHVSIFASAEAAKSYVSYISPTKSRMRTVIPSNKIF